MSHECVIGLMHDYEDINLVTVSELKEHIERQAELREYYRAVGLHEPKVWTLMDYTDKRKTTNLIHFDFCPECGKKIDWKAIRKEDPT